MSAEQYVEKRRYPRSQCFVGVELYPDETSACIMGSLVNVSKGGCCVETPLPLGIGTCLKVNPLGRTQDLHVTGKVVNHRPLQGTLFHAQGIEFTDGPDNEALDCLLKFVERVSSPADPTTENWYLGKLKGG